MLIAGDCRPPGQNWHLREAHHFDESLYANFGLKGRQSLAINISYTTH